MKLFYFLIATTFIFSSCKKEGCVDSDAINYDEKAKTDDGSCKYECDFVIWFNQGTSEEMAADGITELNFYLGGESFGSLSVDDYTNLIPECYGTDGLTTKVDLGSEKDRIDKELKVLDNMGEVIDYGFYPGLDANECYQYKFEYY